MTEFEVSDAAGLVASVTEAQAIVSRLERARDAWVEADEELFAALHECLRRQVWKPLGFPNAEEFFSTKFNAENNSISAKGLQQLAERLVAAEAQVPATVLAYVVGKSVRQVQRTVAQAREKDRVVRQATFERAARAADLRARGFTQTDVADQLGVRQSTVHNLLKLNASAPAPTTAAVPQVEVRPTQVSTVSALLSEAAEKAVHGPAAATSLRNIIDDDAFVSDPWFKGDLAEILAEPLAKILRQCWYVADQLGLDTYNIVATQLEDPATFVEGKDPRPRARLERMIVQAKARGRSVQDIAEANNLDPAQVADLIRARANLPADRVGLEQSYRLVA